jgi:hypothetical protein
MPRPFLRDGDLGPAGSRHAPNAQLAWLPERAA